MAKSHMVHLAISFGGTKIAVAIVGSGKRPIIRQTDRIEWRTDPMWKPETPLESLLALVTSHARKLLREAGLTIQDVTLIGIAWPGPGRYSTGELTATFIPGCTTHQPVHQLLLDEFRRQFGSLLTHLTIISCLDVNARAYGEVRMPRGAFHAPERSPKPSGIALNIATGIAGAIVRGGNVLSTFGALGETYGQWGRYLFKNSHMGGWEWKPTKDGAIPEHDIKNEIRFTRLCGGPALAQRFADRCHAFVRVGQQLPPAFASVLTGFPTNSVQRDLQAEKALLIRITQVAYDNDTLARSFVEEVGTEIGGALRCLRDALGEAFGNVVVLTGGVGEFFGAPLQDSHSDTLLAAIQSTLKQPDIRIVRSTVGLDAELVGFAP